MLIHCRLLTLSKRWGRLWAGCQSIARLTRRQTPIHHHIHTNGQLENPIDLICMPLGCGRKPKCTWGNLCRHGENKLTTGIKPGTFLLWNPKYTKYIGAHVHAMLTCTWVQSTGKTNMAHNTDESKISVAFIALTCFPFQCKKLVVS